MGKGCMEGAAHTAVRTLGMMLFAADTLLGADVDLVAACTAIAPTEATLYAMVDSAALSGTITEAFGAARNGHSRRRCSWCSRRGHRR
jgi:Flp pilus assembly protein protease CpaA